MSLPRLFPRPVTVLCLAALFAALCAAAPPHGHAEPAPGKTRFSIIRVEADDMLNMRIVPDPNAAKVGAIHPDARGIEATGRTAKRGDYIWREVIYQGVTGWVNGHFLLRDRSGAQPAPPAAAQAAAKTAGDNGETRVFLEPLSCSGTEPFWGLLLKGRQTVLDSLGEGPTKLTLSPARQSPQMSTAWAIDAQTTEEKRPVSIIVRRTNQCSDGMSDIIFPYETFITIHGGPFYAGCCNVTEDHKQAE